MNACTRIFKRPLSGLIAVLLLAVLVACTPENNAVSQQLFIEPIDNPASAASSLPHVSSNADEVIVSWVHKTSQGHALSFARSNNGALEFSPAQKISEGTDWFVNWADFPAVFLSSTGQLAAHWLQRTTPKGYGYDIAYATSSDGTNWTTPALLHSDGTHTEHGFVSWFEHKQQLGAIWLDGRNTQAADNPLAHHASGPMALRGRLLNEASIELDSKVCDCCQTSAVSTSEGPVFFYRDRSDDEIRDIYVKHSLSSANDATAANSAPVHTDQWRIEGCPVNGPQADAIDNRIVTAWFTMADGVARVKVARSLDGGRKFGPPIVLSTDVALGRVDTVMLNAQRTLVSYLEKSDNHTAIWRVALLDEHLNVLSTENLATVNNARGSGFVRMKRLGPQDDSLKNASSGLSGRALAAWSEGVDENSRIRTALLSVK